MAAEIQYSITLSINKANIGGLSASASLSKDMAGSEMIGATQSLTTTAAAVNIGGCDQVQSLFIKNLSATESVAVGLDSTVTTQRFATIKPGGAIILEQPPTLVYAKTVSGIADVWVTACED